MESITYYELPQDIHMQFLSHLDDNVLRNFCLVTRYNFKLCDEVFWYQRIASRGLKPLLPFRSFYKSLPEFYFNIRQDACYIVANVDGLILSNLRVYDNIVEALNAAKEDKYQTLITAFIFNRTMMSADVINHYTIWSSTGGPQQHNPDILNYPKLRGQKFVVIKRETLIVDDNKVSSLQLLDFSNETLRQNLVLLFVFVVNSSKSDMMFRGYKGNYILVPMFPANANTILLHHKRTPEGPKYSVISIPNTYMINQGGHRIYFPAIRENEILCYAEHGLEDDSKYKLRATITDLDKWEL